MNLAEIDATRWPHWRSDDGNVLLINADCRDALDAIWFVDATITDPIWPNVPDGMFPGTGDPCCLLAESLAKLPITCKRVVVIMRTDSDPRFLAAVPDGFEFFRTANLEYVSPGHLGRKLGGMEIAYAFGSPIPSRDGQRVIPGNAPKAQPGGTCKDHPCARNIEHMQFVVRWYSEEGEVVLDPFMGSGTTGVACVRLGRQFIGIELEPRYYEIAIKRIKAEIERFPLFEKVEAKERTLFE